MRQSEVVALRQSATLVIGWQQVLRPCAADKEWLIHVSRSAGCALVEVIGAQTLSRAGKTLFRTFDTEIPIVRWPRERAGIGGYEVRCNRARQPFKAQPAPLPCAVVRSPSSVPDHILLAIERAGSLIQNHA